MKRKQIDNTIRIAISNLRQTCASNEEAGERLSITGKHLASILSGEIEAINNSTWETMEPVLRPLIARAGKEISVSIEKDQAAEIAKLAAANHQTTEEYIKSLISDEIKQAQKYRALSN